MKEQLISFETAKLAKEKGFDWMTRSYIHLGKWKNKPVDAFGTLNHNKSPIWKQTYDDKGECDFCGNVENTEIFSVPTQSMLEKWLREVHEIDVCATYSHGLVTGDGKRWDVYCTHFDYDPFFESEIYYRTKEAALEMGLFKALEEIKSPEYK